MDSKLIENLIGCETDLNGAMRRFSQNEALYIRCLNEFVNDPTMTDLETSISTGMWDDAFTAAHALKGLAGNMGFIPLFHSTAELVVAIRAGRTNEVGELFENVKDQYIKIIAAILQKNCVD